MPTFFYLCTKFNKKYVEKFIDLVKTRRSMRKFTDDRVTDEELKELMRAALMAPSSKGSHCWEFAVVEDAAVLTQLSTCKQVGSAFLAEAPMAIVVLADPQVSDVWIEDASVASTMLLLQAEDLGLGACWVQIRDRQDENGVPAEEIVRRILRIPEHLRILSIVAVGRKGMERKPFNEDRLLWNKIHKYDPLQPLFEEKN